MARQIDLAQGDLPDVQIVHTAHPCTPPTMPTHLGEMRSCCCHHRGLAERAVLEERGEGGVRTVDGFEGGVHEVERDVGGDRLHQYAQDLPQDPARAPNPPPKLIPVQFHPRREKRQRKRKHVKGNSGYLTVVKRVITPKTRDAIGSAKLK